MEVFFISIRNNSAIRFLSLGWKGNTLFPQGKDLTSIHEHSRLWDLLPG